LRYLLSGSELASEAGFMSTTDASSKSSKNPVVGICCSGGGIRSASFSLGCLQILDGHGLLRGAERAGYISAVSGGSYAVGAMAVLEHHRQTDDHQAELLPDVGPYDPESPEFRRLRNRLTYLTHPSDGLVAEIWRAVMGVAMNLMLFSAVAAIIGFLLGWAYGAALPQLRSTCDGGSQCSTAVHPPNRFYFSAAALGVGALILGLVWVGRRWSLRVNRWLQIGVLGAALIAAAYALFVLVLPQVLAWLHRATLPPAEQPAASAVADGLSTNYWIPATGFVGVAAAIWALLAPVWKFFRPKIEAEGNKWLRSPKFRTRLLNLVAFLSVPALFGGLLLVVMHLGAEDPPFVHGNGGWRLFFYVIVPVAVLLAVRKCGDLNNWSLHTVYKARLAEAFAAARFTPPTDHLSTSKVTQESPRPHDVDADHEHSGLLPLDAVQPDDFPQVLICATSNITSYGVAPTGTGALPFLFSSESVGGAYVGELKTNEYARWGFRRVSDLTIMDAVSISGAAVSPEMGRMTRPALRFLMALANLRLGVWLPKPGRVEDHVDGRKQPATTPLEKAVRRIATPMRKYHKRRINELKAKDERIVAAEPPPRFFRKNVGAMRRPGVQKLVNEALGTTPVRTRYVYVTDGGHFDNLGLVELLKRGCDQIWCIDASGDQVDTFNTLGQALSIAKAEYDIDVEINPLRDMAPEPAPVEGTTPVVQKPFCIGTITYPLSLGGSKGQLVLVKAGVPKNAGLDLVTFHNENPKFPCDPTTNQLSRAERFDAYVALGRLSMDLAHDAVSTNGQLATSGP
jgi:hypothetical protein